MKKLYLYPIWLRIWHILNATLMIILFITGISLHYSETASLIFPFKITILIHNICGILLSLNYLFFITFNLISGNYKHYLPKFKSFLKEVLIQIRYYLIDIFDEDPHPFPPNEKRKFNPLQRLAYLSIMYFFVPIIVLTGWMLMFPEYSPDEILGMGGVWPAAILHIIAGFIISLFTIVHIYLGTTGHTIADLYKGIITGWHEVEDDYQEDDEIRLKKLSKRIEKGKLLPKIFYNPISISGFFITIISFTIILFFSIIEIFGAADNPYLGIFTFMVLPIVLFLGVFLIFFGAFRENRLLLQDNKKERRLPIIDLNNRKHQIATIVFTISSIVLIIFSGFGSYKAYEYSESDEFCGTVCHKVMVPEYTTYLNSPHSNVGCVKCHIGPGAGWFVKSKISGAYQVYAVLAGVYPMPIKSPISNLRPASEICEECHSPKHFYDQKVIKRDYYLSDKNNTKFSLSMSVKVGGGNQEIGNIEGIHWHMNLANEITYLATDKEKQIIPWVKSKNKRTGKETVYQVQGFDVEKALEKGYKLKKMDCIDCHNRPSHIYNPPDKMLNLYMSLNKIDPSIPFIKSIAYATLEEITSYGKEAQKDIYNKIWNFYRNKKDIKLDNPIIEKINKAILEISNIYSKNYFPQMKTNWKVHSNNIGHFYSEGCYRCHDGKHISFEGQILTKDCNSCHTFQTEIIPKDSINKITIYNQFIHPGGNDKDIIHQNCVVCHGAPKFRKKILNEKSTKK